MSLKYALKYMYVLFCSITTFLIIFVSVQDFIFSTESLFTPMELLHLVFIALASVLPILLFVWISPRTRRGNILLNVFHFLLTAAIVIGLTINFSMISVSNAVSNFIFFLSVYFGSYIVQEIRARKLADKLNEKINESHRAENETHR